MAGLQLCRRYCGLAFLALSTENVILVRIYHPYAVDLPAGNNNSNIAKALTQWRRSCGDHLPSRQHCDKRHRKHRKRSQFAPSTTRHSSSIHNSSDPQNPRYRRRKMSPSSSKRSGEDINRLYITLLPRVTCDSVCSMALAFLAQPC